MLAVISVRRTLIFLSACQDTFYSVLVNLCEPDVHIQGSTGNTQKGILPLPQNSTVSYSSPGPNCLPNSVLLIVGS